MPKLFRILLTGAAFTGFFLFGCLIGRLLLPLIAHFPGTAEQKKRRVAVAICSVYRTFINILRATRLIRYRRPPMPPDFPRSGGYVVISNHPSLIDTLILMGLSPGLCSVVKATWWHSWILRPLMRYANHIPGPDRNPALLPARGVQEDMSFDSLDGEDIPAVITRMVEHLKAGNPLVVFPEGSRSFERKMRRFRRGALEAAIRAGVPIVPVFISVNPPMLMKHQPWHEVPERPGCYRLEFFPVIETVGRDIDARALNRQLREKYEARFAEMLRERDADALAAKAPARSLPAASSHPS